MQREDVTARGQATLEAAAQRESEMLRGKELAALRKTRSVPHAALLAHPSQGAGVSARTPQVRDCDPRHADRQARRLSAHPCRLSAGAFPIVTRFLCGGLLWACGHLTALPGDFGGWAVAIDLPPLCVCGGIRCPRHRRIQAEQYKRECRAVYDASEVSGPLLGSLTEKYQSFPRDWCRKHQTHRIHDLAGQ
jgi:hypothetical protein